MAIHVGHTCAPGTEWAFNKSLKLEEIKPSYAPKLYSSSLKCSQNVKVPMYEIN